MGQPADSAASGAMAAASESLVFTSSQYTEPTQEVVYSSNNEESSDSEETDANGLTDHDDGHDYENDSVETLSGDDSDSSSDEAGGEEQDEERPRSAYAVPIIPGVPQQYPSNS